MKKSRQFAGILRGKKALVMGLGLHGGGVATVRWLMRRGVKVTVTDLRDKGTLMPSIRALKGLPIRYVLGRHRMEDFRSHDLIVVGPGVPRESPYLRATKKAGKMIENDASLFFRYLKSPAIAVTGTRGKTTTTLWVAELLKKKYPAVRQSGTPENAELKEFERIKGKNVPAVVELSSWQLEYLPRSGKAPHIAAITNIYPEHLNRYRDIKAYADAKANIFKYQEASDMLVLNCDDPWHRYFLKKKPKSTLYYISRKPLPKKLSGVYVKNGRLMMRTSAVHQGRTLGIQKGLTLVKEHTLFSVKRFVRERGEHNLENLLRAVLVAKLFDSKLHITEREVLRLPTPRMRQETIYRKGRLTVVNDSCATSPDGTIAAIRRLAQLGNPTSKSLGRRVSKSRVVLITGGTDKKLEFDGLAKEIKKYIPKEQLILLEGSATTKLIAALRKLKYFSRYELLEYLSLESCVKEAFRVARQNRSDGTRWETAQGLSLARKGESLKGLAVSHLVPPTIILFSPGAASFEKFLHEFDRGEQFNALVKTFVN